MEDSWNLIEFFSKRHKFRHFNKKCIFEHGTATLKFQNPIFDQNWSFAMEFKQDLMFYQQNTRAVIVSGVFQEIDR